MSSSARAWASAHIGSLLISAVVAVGVGSLVAGCGLNSGGNGFPTPPTVVSVTKSSGDAQTGTPGTALPQPLVALVTDQFNTPLNNVPVVWTVTSGGGAVTATVAPTNSAGLSQTILTLGPGPGTNTATAAVGSASATFTEIGGTGGGGGLSMFVTGFPGRVIVGTAYTCIVTVKDSTGAVFTGYRGTVKITSTDPLATLPANYTFTAADNGSHAFTVTLNSFGTWGIIATDVNTPTLTGKETPILAGGGPATQFLVTGMPSPYSQGALSDIVITAADAKGITDTAYGGTIKFTTTDAGAGVLLPANYTFTLGDAGVHRFSLGVKLQTVGSQTVTATDTVTATIKGSQTVTVSATLRVTSFTAATPKVSVKGTDALSWTFVGTPTGVTLNGTSAGLPKAESLTSPGTDTPAAPFPGGTPPGPAGIDPQAFFRLTATNAAFPTEVPEVTQVARGGGGTTVANAVAAFSDGSYVIAGSFTGSANFSGTTLSAGGKSAFIVRYKSDGSLDWASQNLGTSIDTAANGVATFSDGSLVMTGYFTGTATFGSKSLVSAGGKDIFIVRYKADGSVDWALSAGGTSADVGTCVATFVDGGLAVAGNFAGTAKFSSTVSLTSAGLNDIFVARYAPDGTLIFAKKLGGVGDDLAFGLAGTSDGHMVVTGSTPGAGGATDALTTSLNSDGTIAWSSSLHSSTAVVNAGRGSAAFADGSVVVTGLYRGTATFSATATTLTSTGGADVFTVRYSPTGTIVWAVSAGGATGDDQGAGVSVFPDGSVALAGAFQGTSTFGGSTLTSNGMNDAFLCRLALATGAVIWARGVGGSTDDFGLGVGTTPDGSAVVAGSFTGSATVGPGCMISAVGAPDAFVARFSPVNYGMLSIRPQGFDVCGASSCPASISALGGYTTVNTLGAAGFPDGSYVATGNYQEYTTLYYHTGAYTGPLFGGIATNETSYDYSNNQFVARYKPDGTVAWVASPKLTLYTGFGGYCYSQGEGIAAFPDGTCAVIGSYYVYPAATVDFGGGFTITGSYESGSYVVRYSATGVCTALKKYASITLSGQMAGFSDGGFAIFGTFYSSLTVDAVTVKAPSFNASFFVISFDKTSTAVWGASGGAGGSTYAYSSSGYPSSQGIASFPDGSCVVTGYYVDYSGATGLSMTLTDSKGTTSTLSDSTASPYESDAFFVKFKSDGTVSWSNTSVQAPSSKGASAYAQGQAVASVPDGSTIVSGYFYDKVTFGSTTVGTASTSGMFIAKYSSDGSTVSWAAAPTVSSYAYPNCAAAFGDGSCVITGYFGGTITFKAGVSVTTTTTAPFVARYNSDGTVAWAKTTTPSGYSYGTSIVAFADNSCVLAGIYSSGSMTVGDSTEPAKTTLAASAGFSTDFFFAKYFNY